MSLVGYRADIDGLRAVAVLGVVAYHVSPHALPGGFLGVDIFFVISGYLISLIVLRELSNGTFSFVRFYERRVRRLFPALIVVLAAVLIVGAIALFADEYRHLARHVAASIVFVLNFQLMREAGYFDVVSDSKPLLHLWSLSVEEQFYLIWPVLLVLAQRLALNMRALISLAIAGSFLFAVYLAIYRLDALYFHPLARFWELLAGSALAMASRTAQFAQGSPVLGSERRRDLLSVLALAAIGLSLVLLDSKIAQPGLSTVIPIGATVLLIATGPSALANRVLSLRPIVWIGLISYPLYLWHWPVISIVRIAESGTPPGLLIACSVALSCLLAWLTYRFIEGPIRRRSAQGWQTAGLIIGMAGVLVAAAVVVQSKGFPDRASLKASNDALALAARAAIADEACRGRFNAQSAPVYCREDGLGDAWVVVIGDSHAHAVYPGVADHVRQLGLKSLLLANSGCPPLEGTTWGRNGSEHSVCAISIESILGTVDRLDQVFAIIVASRGPQYITGKGFGPAEAHYDYPPLFEWSTSEHRARKVTDAAALFEQGLENTVRRLSVKGAPVIYLLQVPELGIRVADCLERPLRLYGAHQGCRVSQAVFEERMRSYRDGVYRVAQRQMSLLVADPSNIFCDGSNCVGTKQGRLLYSDDNHLSAEGARQVASNIFAAIQESHPPSRARKQSPQ